MKNRRFSFQSQDELQDTSVNLTPLIDVVFVVLIIFMLVAPLIETDRIELACGNPYGNEKQNSVNTKSLTIYVRSDNTIWLNKQPINLDQLKHALKQAYLKNPDQIPQLFQDKEATFESYQNVKNAVEIAGFHYLDIILKPG